ncbi:MAG: ParB-like protein [Bdellovibrionales bacterium]
MMIKFLAVYLASQLAWSQWVEVNLLLPTQFAVGLKAATQKAKENLHLMSENKFYLENPVPVVKGPQNKLYMIDGHHFTRGVYEMDYPYVFVKVEHDWSHLSPQAFWKKMKENNLVYLKDENGNDRQVKDLPKSVAQLKDDPYRSLAWYVRKKGGFKKTSQYFFEFIWAEFFRSEIPLTKLNEDFKNSVKIALLLALSKKAEHLPGFIKTGGTPQCQSVVSQ